MAGSATRQRAPLLRQAHGLRTTICLGPASDAVRPVLLAEPHGVPVTPWKDGTSEMRLYVIYAPLTLTLLMGCASGPMAGSHDIAIHPDWHHGFFRQGAGTTLPSSSGLTSFGLFLWFFGPST